MADLTTLPLSPTLPGIPRRDAETVKWANDFTAAFIKVYKDLRKQIINTVGTGTEATTASNVGTAGVGVFKALSGTDLQFRKINAGSSKVTVTLDSPHNEIDIDVDSAAISTALAGDFVNVSGDTMTGDLLMGDKKLTLASGGRVELSMPGLSLFQPPNQILPVTGKLWSAHLYSDDVPVQPTQVVPAANVGLSTNVVQTASAHGWLAGQKLAYRNGGGVGITHSGGVDLSNNECYVKTVPTGDTMTLSLTLGGATLDIDGQGNNAQSFADGYVTIFEIAGWAVGSGTTAVVGVFGEARADGIYSKAWGGNFVAYSNYALADAHGIEINFGKLGATDGGSNADGTGTALGLYVVSNGHDWQTDAYIRMQSSAAVCSPVNGIELLMYGAVSPVTGTALYIDATCVTGIDLSDSAFSGNAIETPGFSLNNSGQISTGSEAIELNALGTGNRNCYIDLHSDDTNTDYSARVIRNSGVNGVLAISQAGTGNVTIGHSSAAVYVTSGGDFGIGSSPSYKLHVVDGSRVLWFNDDGAAVMVFQDSASNGVAAFKIKNDVGAWDLRCSGTDTFQLSHADGGTLDLEFDTSGHAEFKHSVRGPKCRLTEEGGFAVLLTAGEALSLGNVVYVQAAGGADGKVWKNPIDSDMPIGVAYAAASADASVWVVTSGIVSVLPESGVTATRGYVIYSSNAEVGVVDEAASVPAALQHFREVGHWLDTGSGAGAATRAIVHFN